MTIILCILIVIACALLVVLATYAAGLVERILDDLLEHPERYT
jgi:cell division protein FtsL